MKTLSDLNSKAWFRAIKVLYFVLFLLSVYFSVEYTFSKVSFWGWTYFTIRTVLGGIIDLLLIAGFFEALKRTFYYIYFGKIFPKKIL